MTMPEGFLWGAATSAHQAEGNNVLSDWWRTENRPGSPLERSGDAIDHYHRYPEDIAMLAQGGLNAYRFSIEWARIEPAKGHISRAVLDHYRRMIDTCRDQGLEPMVTLHHFTSPTWFNDEGGWTGATAADSFVKYVESVIPILNDVTWITTFNEPNTLAMLVDQARHIADGQLPTSGSIPAPPEDIGEALMKAHQPAIQALRASTSGQFGITLASQALTPTPGNEEVWKKYVWAWEDLYYESVRGDDYVGIQSYTSQPVDANGPVPHPPSPTNTQAGWAYRPDAVGIALRHAHDVLGDMPLIVSENGIATDDDSQRTAYITEAVGHVQQAIADGIDVRGYVVWSAFDNYEWGSWNSRYGLVSVDRDTFVRTPKQSFADYCAIARGSGV